MRHALTVSTWMEVWSQPASSFLTIRHHSSPCNVFRRRLHLSFPPPISCSLVIRLTKDARCKSCGNSDSEGVREGKMFVYSQRETFFYSHD